jgi:hypothetical protein
MGLVYFILFLCVAWSIACSIVLYKDRKMLWPKEPQK